MPVDEKYVFTYEDYLNIKYKEGLCAVAENETEYQAAQEEMEKEKKEGGKIHQKHDKSFKKALSSKKEMTFFLKEFVGIEVETKDIEEYKNEFITKQYGKRQSDVIYKNTKKEIYYIVEHQSTKDRQMPKRIAQYCLELIEDILGNSKNEEIYPTIVPIVLYTGKGKWNVDTNFANRQKFSEGTYEEYKIDIKYTVVDINKIKDMRLLEKQDYLANMMLMEKCKTNEERAEMFKRIYNEMNSKSQKEKILNYTINIYKQILEPEEIEKLYKVLEGSGEKMTAMYQYIVQERNENRAIGRKEGRTIGRKEAIAEVAQKMLKLKMPIKQIIEATGLSQKDVEKLAEAHKI